MRIPRGGEDARTIDELFALADVVSLHCPLTPETRHVVNAERLAPDEADRDPRQYGARRLRRRGCA